MLGGCGEVFRHDFLQKIGRMGVGALMFERSTESPHAELLQNQTQKAKGP